MPLPNEVVAELGALITVGAELADVTPDATPLEIATSVDTLVRRAHREERKLTENEIAGLAVLWGKAVSQAGGWTWALIVRDDVKVVSLVSTNHAHACHPLAYMKAQADPGRETTAHLVFNLIRTGALPESKSDALEIVG